MHKKCNIEKTHLVYLEQEVGKEDLLESCEVSFSGVRKDELELDKREGRQWGRCSEVEGPAEVWSGEAAGTLLCKEL